MIDLSNNYVAKRINHCIGKYLTEEVVHIAKIIWKSSKKKRNQSKAYFDLETSQVTCTRHHAKIVL